MGKTGHSSDAEEQEQGDLAGFVSEAEREHEFQVEISYDILRQVSSQLYTNPRRAIEELVCNSYDAAATECYVSTPETTADILQVLDNGVSMNKDEMEILWEVAGGTKKELAEQGEDRVINADDIEGRRQIGRFGVGKLAAFALGNELTHVATKNGVTRIISVRQEDIEGHDVGNPPKAEIYRMDEEEARDYLGAYLDGLPDPWDQGWDSWTLAVVDDVDEDSSGRDLKPEYLDRMIRTAIPRSAKFIAYRNGQKVEPRDYPDEHYAQIANLANDEDAREKVEEGLKKFWVDWSDEYDEADDVPEEKCELDIVSINPYEESGVAVDDGDVTSEGTTTSEVDEREDDEAEAEASSEEARNEEFRAGVAAVEVGELGPVVARGTIYKEILTRDKLKDRNLHDYGFKVRVRGKLLNRGDPLFGTRDKVYQWFKRFHGEFEIPELDDEILVQRDSVREGLKPELSRTVMEGVFSVLRNRAVEAQREEGEKYDPEEFGHRLHSISPYKAPQALEGLANRDDTDYPEGGWKDVDVHIAEHGRDGNAVDYKDGTIYVNTDHPLFRSLEADDMPNELVKVVGEALAGNLIASGYLSYKDVREDLVDDSIDISEDALRTASRFLEEPIEYYKEQIETASHEGDDPFEQAIVDALNHIGIEAEHYGNSGDSDAIITFGVQGNVQFKVSLEAKGKEEGAVDHSEAEFSTALEHMDSDDCDHTVFVAREFQLDGPPGVEDSKLLKQYRRHDDLTLLTVEAVKEMLDRHADRGFSHERIKNIMTTDAEPGDGELLDVIEEEWNEMPEETGVMRTVLEEARQQFLDETVDAPDIGMVRAALRDEGKDSIDKDTIRTALTIAEADTGMVSFDPDDNSFSIHQTPEQIMKEMDRSGDDE